MRIVTASETGPVTGLEFSREDAANETPIIVDTLVALDGARANPIVDGALAWQSSSDEVFAINLDISRTLIAGVYVRLTDQFIPRNEKRPLACMICDMDATPTLESYLWKDIIRPANDLMTATRVAYRLGNLLTKPALLVDQRSRV